MRINIVIIVAISFILTSLTSCTTAKFYSYFPHQKDKEIVFKTRIDSTLEESNDTLICREHKLVSQQFNRNDKYIGLYYYPTLKQKHNNFTIFFYEKKIFDSSEFRYDVLDHNFMKRIYTFIDKRFYTAIYSYQWENGIVFRNIFPKRLKKKVCYLEYSGDYAKGFFFVGKVSVSIDGKLYQNCIKIDVIETWGGFYRCATLWFAKDIGLIKRDIKHETISKDSWIFKEFIKKRINH